MKYLRFLLLSVLIGPFPAIEGSAAGSSSSASSSASQQTVGNSSDEQTKRAIEGITNRRWDSSLSGGGKGLPKELRRKVYEYLNEYQQVKNFQGLSHKNRLTTSSDSDMIVVAPDGNIYAWQRNKHGILQCIATLQGHGDKVMSVFLSADKRTILSGSGDLSVSEWRLAPTSRVIRTIEMIGKKLNRNERKQKSTHVLDERQAKRQSSGNSMPHVKVAAASRNSGSSNRPEEMEFGVHEPFFPFISQPFNPPTLSREDTIDLGDEQLLSPPASATESASYRQLGDYHPNCSKCQRQKPAKELYLESIPEQRPDIKVGDSWKKFLNLDTEME